MTSKTLTQKKYEDIRKDYEKLCNKKYKDCPIHSQSYMVKKLSEKFYLSIKTINDVIYNRI